MSVIEYNAIKVDTDEILKDISSVDMIKVLRERHELPEEIDLSDFNTNEMIEELNNRSAMPEPEYDNKELKKFLFAHFKLRNWATHKDLSEELKQLFNY